MQWKGWQSCCFLYLALSLTITTEASSLELTATEYQWIIDHPRITVANETDWPPFDFAIEGRPQGYAIDLIQLLAEKAGLEVDFVTGPTWAELLEQLRNGSIDVVPAIYTSREREAYMDFSASYFSQPSVIVVKKNNPEINDFANLSGKKLAGVKDFTINEVLRRDYPDIELVIYDTVVDCLKAVSIGEVDAYIDSIGLVAFTLDNNFVPNLRIIGDIDNPGLSNPPLHIGVTKDNTTLLAILDKALAAVTAEEKQWLAKKWLAVSDYEKRLILTREQANWIRNHRTVNVGLDADYPPYSFRDENGNYAGIAVDFLNLISEKTGITFVIKPDLQWRQMLNGIRDKSLAIAAPIVQTVERDEYMVFSPPFINAPLVIMTRNDNTAIQSPKDIAAHTIALVEGYSSSERVVRENPHIGELWVKSPLEGLQAVSTGQADAFIGIVGVNIYLSQKHGINNLKVAATYDLQFDGQRFAVRSDWPQLAVLVSRALDAITADQRSEIYDRWIRIPDTREIDYSLVWQIVAGFVVLMIAMYAYNRRLANEIQQRALAEQKLINTNQKLEIARAAADNANQSKSRFVSTISHELKTPLNAIIGFSDLLRNDNAIREDARTHCELIFDAGQHLDHLINDLLDLSKIEAGKMVLHIHPVSLGEVVEESLVLTRMAAEKRRIIIHNQLATLPPQTVLADRTRLKQVLLNLLSNAVKYNTDNGVIEVRYEQMGNGKLKMLISDTGVGLNPEQLEQLFVYFERAGAEHTPIKGNGIGLALSKNLVEMMGEEIGVNSAMGEGSTFWFTLSLAP